MQNVTVALNPDEMDRLQRVLKPDQTAYAFVKDAVLARIYESETARDANGPQPIKPIVLEMVQALRERKWHLYQIDDYSDKNHREWITGRFRKATKTEILDAIALFRTKVMP